MFILLLLFSSSLVSAADDPNEPIRIGVPLCSTGKYENEAREIKAGYDLWAKTINDGPAGGISVEGKQRKVNLIYVDDQSSPAINKQVTERVLIQQHKVQFLFGSYASEITAETAKVAKKYKIPLITGGASADFLFTKGGFLCSVLTPASRYLLSTLELLKKSSSAKTVSILYEQVAFAQEAKDGAVAACARLGFAVQQQLASPLYDALVERDPVKQVTAKQDIKALVTKLKEQHADVVLNIGHFYDDERFFWALKELQLKPKALVFTIGPALPEFIQNHGPDAEGVLSPAHWNATLPYQDAIFGSAFSYANRFRSEYGYDPNYLNAAATASGLMLQAAVKQAKSIDGDKVMQALFAVDMMTFYGKIKIDDTGKNIGGSMVVTQIQNGKSVIVGPEKYATNKLVYK